MEIDNRFLRSYAANTDLAMKTLFYARDIRGGLGEWPVFRTILRWLEENGFVLRASSSEEMNQIYEPEHPGYQDRDMLLWQLFGMDDAVEGIHDAVFVLSRADVLRFFFGEDSMFCTDASAQPTAWVRKQQDAEGLCLRLRLNG